MTTVLLIGGSPATPVDRNGRRYHITWCFTAAPFVPNGILATHQLATLLQESLPALGLIPVSPVAAINGDPFIQFTIQVASSGPGADIYDLADIIAAADRLPLLSDGLTSPRIALDVCEVEIRQSSFPGADAGMITRAQNAAARTRAEDRAKAAEVTTKAGNVVSAIGEATKDALGTTGDKLDSLFGGLKDLATFALGMAAIVGLVFVIVRFQK